MTLHLEGDELRLAERAIEALETIAEKLTVEPEAPKSMPVPERFSLTENRRFVDGYCEAATIDGGKVTRRCLRGKDHDGECDMRDVCRGTPGMASWKRCEKAKGHVNPCTYDPSTNDGHVSPANDDDGLPDRAEATAHVLDCFESFLAGMRNSPDWTPKERGAVRKAIEAARETLEGKCTCDTPGGVHPPPCPKGDALERAAEREALSVGREVVRGRRPVSALVEAFRRLVPRDEHAGRAEHALLTGACPVAHGIVHFSGSSDPHAKMNTIRELRRGGFVWPPPSKNERNGVRRMVETTKAPEPHLTLVVEAPTVIQPPEAKTVDQLFAELKEARTYDSLAAEHLAMCRAKVEEATLALASADREKRMAAEDLAGRKAAFDAAFEAST